ncbi:MAG TPA: hypothetical protein VL381_07505, partial [Rhodocyclaceae bacterium]|nr:hypothetical protein [Rhodocyclaceae bacterium]
MNYNKPELLDRLAAEYVLGTLQGPARRRFEKLKATLPATATSVREWEQRTARLADPVPAVAPSPQLWHKIESRLSFAAEKRSFFGLSWLSAFGSFALGLIVAVALVQLYPAQILSKPTLASAAPPPQYVGLFSDANGKTVMFASST